MKIAFVNFDLGRRNAVPSILTNISLELNKKHRVKVFCGIKPRDRGGLSFQSVNFLGFPFFRDFWFSLTSFFWFKKKDFDVAISSGLPFLNSDLVVSPSCILHAVKLLWTHNKKIPIPVSWTDKIIITINIFPALFLEFLVYRFRLYKKIVSVSTIHKNQLMQLYGVPDSDIEVVPCGVEFSRFNSSPFKRSKIRNKIRGELGLKEQKVILFVGTEFLRKGLAYLIESIPLLVDETAVLVVVGDDNRVPYEDQVKRLGIENRVFFVGRKENLQDYYFLSDVFVFPSFYESFGIAALEVMASKIPVLISDNCGVTEFISGDSFLSIDEPWNVKEIARKTDLLLSNSKDVKKMVENAYLDVKDFSWGKVSKKYAKIVAEIPKNKKQLKQ
ncbi:MAG: hypothetical protein CL944_01910 [Candidatus Diapherotrites archaeon]|uniref:Glycosyltransferase family 4 protein n=1 Tax=Candidatus Iainarchaeum sp. TaxID=3101447 RepID=A0A2D6LPT8_9ARCH|nr:hypothetical protein [Candidatus Diapherotrites archaeon]